MLPYINRSIQKWEEPQKFPPEKKPEIQPGKETPGIPVLPPSKPEIIPAEQPKHDKPSEIPEPKHLL